MIKYGIIIFSILLTFSTFPQKDKLLLKGKILDAQTNESLPFANVSIKGSQSGTAADMKGAFTISLDPQTEFITISYVGYKSLDYQIRDADYDSNILVRLQPINIGLQEVTVYSSTISAQEEVQTSNLTIQSERIREISVGMPDILRSVQSLPGIAVNNEFKADFNVRGGNQDENLVLVNGTEVYQPFHIKEASNASIGIFNVDMIKKVNLITGGFSAKYGDKMSSVLDIEYREGQRANYTGAVSLSLAYLDGYAEGPLSSDGSFIIGARKSYMEYVISMIDYENISRAQPSFYDLQGVLSYNLTNSNKILFEFIYANDDFSYDPERITPTKIENENNLANYTSTLLTFKSKNILSGKALLNAEINYYNQGDNEYRLFEREYTNIERFVERVTYDTLDIHTLEFNANLQYQLNPYYEVQLGLTYKNIIYEQKSNDLWTVDNEDSYQGDYGSDRINADSYKYASYMENIFSITDQITFNIGGRMDYFDINKDLKFSPRINAAYKIAEGTTIKGAWGKFRQSPTYDQLKYSEASDSNTQSQLSTHYILGLEKSFILSDKNNSYLNFRIEGYLKEYENLISSYFGVFERITYSKINDATGTATGIDIYAVLNLPGFYSWISYGYLNTYEDIENDGIDEYPRYTDQQHTLSFVSNLDLGKDWSFSLKGYYGSGFPYTPKTAVKNESDIWIWQSGKRHSENLPAYKRVDLRISKLFHFDNFKLATFIDVSNVFNFKNIQQYEYSSVPDIYQPEPEEILLWPILPTFGVRFEF